MSAPDPETPTGFDYEALARSVEQTREVLASLVAGLVVDGFTDEQARSIIAGMFATMAKGSDT